MANDDARSFGAFLKQTKRHDNAAGDFVEDARRDAELCAFSHDDTWHIVAHYLHMEGATGDAVAAGKVVWQRYRRWLGRHTTDTRRSELSKTT